MNERLSASRTGRKGAARRSRRRVETSATAFRNAARDTQGRERQSALRVNKGLAFLVLHPFDVDYYDAHILG